MRKVNYWKTLLVVYVPDASLQHVATTTMKTRSPE